MPHKATVTWVYYAEQLIYCANCMSQLKRSAEESWPLLLRDNAPAVRPLVGQTSVFDCGVEETCHPPHSPGLAPSDWLPSVFRFKETSLWRFSTDDELKYTIEDWLKGQSELFYVTGIEKLRVSYKLCIEKGDYFAKQMLIRLSFV